MLIEWAFEDVPRAPARRMELFQHVVRRDPGFSGFDVSAETDIERWIEADRRFNFHFPLFLSELLDAAGGGGSNTVLAEWGEALDPIAGTTMLVGRAMVASLDAGQLRAAARSAGADTAAWLDRVADDWPSIRARFEDRAASAALRR
jgi:hypothetical protein